MKSADDLVADYLKRLDAALSDLPRARRRELVDEMSTHIAEARATGDGESEAAIRNLLERLGAPEEIAAEARAGLGIQLVRPGWREVSALVLLAIGGIVLPVVGWIIGVILLWGSPVWTRNEKLLGTFAVPGGLAMPVFMAGFLVEPETCTSVNGVDKGCTGGGDDTLWAIVWVATIVITLASIGYLAWRLQKKSNLAKSLAGHIGDSPAARGGSPVVWIVLAVLGFMVVAGLFAQFTVQLSSDKTTSSSSQAHSVGHRGSDRGR